MLQRHPASTLLHRSHITTRFKQAPENLRQIGIDERCVWAIGRSMCLSRLKQDCEDVLVLLAGRASLQRIDYYTLKIARHCNRDSDISQQYSRKPIRSHLGSFVSLKSRRHQYRHRAALETREKACSGRGFPALRRDDEMPMLL